MWAIQTTYSLYELLFVVTMLTKMCVPGPAVYYPNHQKLVNFVNIFLCQKLVAISKYAMHMYVVTTLLVWLTRYTLLLLAIVPANFIRSYYHELIMK